MAKVSVEQALAKAKSHIKKGETAEAQALYVTILKAFLEHIASLCLHMKIKKTIFFKFSPE